MHFTETHPGDVVVVKEDVAEFLSAYGLHLETVMSVTPTGRTEPVWDVTVNSKSIPLTHTFVANGFITHNSSSSEYIENMMEANGIDMPIDQVFGIRDPKTSKWAVAPRVRYYSEGIAEKFFDYLAKLERMLPDKLLMNDKWYYVYEGKTSEGKIHKANQTKVGKNYDVKYFQKTGKYRIEAPDGNLQALVIVDSYPAMLSEKQDVDDPGSAMAMQARMFSEQLKRVKGRMRSKRICVVGVNQLRKAPMVAYGNPEYEPCFVGNTQVLLADGTTDTIRNIVNKKRKLKVLSFNKDTGEVSEKAIIGWKNNGNVTTDKLVTVRYASYDHNGIIDSSEFTATRNHKIWTPEGWKEAGNLEEGSEIFLNMPEDQYNEDQLQIIYGSLLGDGVFATPRKSINWNVMYTHVRYQVPYMMWKAQCIDFGDPFEVFNDSAVQRYKPSGANSSYTTYKHFNRSIARYSKSLKSNHVVHGQKESTLVEKLLDKLTLAGLSVWYMDDGYFANDRKNGLWVNTISCDRFEDSSKQKAIEVIKRLTGATAHVDANTGKITVKGKEECLLFQESIADYIHPSMAYKMFDCASVGEYSWEMSDPETKNVLYKTKVLSVKRPTLKSKYVNVYDLTIEDNHTYFVGGSNAKIRENRTRRNVKADAIAVSNCGESLKFYSDVRLRMQPRVLNSAPGMTKSDKGMILEEKSVLGGVDKYRMIHVRAHKNKLSVPNMDCWLRLWIEDSNGAARGFDPVWDTWRYLVETGQATGKRNAIKLNIKGREATKVANWLDFKRLILGTRTEMKEIYARIGVKKPFDLRAWCKKDLADGPGLEKIFAVKKAGLKEEKEEAAPVAISNDADEE